MIHKLKKFINKGSSRTILAKKNILFSFFIKFFSMFIIFAMVPISINYLGKETYGIWIVLSGFITMTNIFDLGFSHGLRNKLAEENANNNLKLGRYYTSTTYAFLVFISIILIPLFIIMIDFVNLQTILNTTVIENKELKSISILIFSFFIFLFLLKPIGSILDAFQWPSIHQLIIFISSLLSFILILTLLFYEHNTNHLYTYIYILSGVPVLVFFCVSVYLFRTKFKYLSPSIKFVKINYINKIAKLGIVFFIIQLNALIIFQSDNMIISYLFGPTEVTTYNIVYKYFSILITIFAIIMTPFWSAFTDAYHKNDFLWIEKIMKKLFYIMGLISIISIIFFLFSSTVYKYWIHQNTNISELLSALMACYAILFTFNNIVAFFSNGIGKIKIQLYGGIIAAILNVPLSYYFSKTLELGTSGVLLATIICLLFVDILLFIQYRKIVTKKAVGIWNA